MSIHVCKCIHNGREEYHLRYPGMTQEAAQELADKINAEALAEQPAQHQEPKLPEFYARFEDGLVSVYQRREDATPLLLLRENLPDKQPAQQEPEPDRVKFERHWRKTRGDKKANRELPRHPLQPQTYIQDSANRHWVTWQAAVRSVSPPASKPLTDEEIWDEVKAADLDWQTGWSLDEDASNRYITFARAIETAHGIKENT